MKTGVVLFLALCVLTFVACGRSCPPAQTPASSEPADGKAQVSDDKAQIPDDKAEPPPMDPGNLGETDPPEQPSAKQDSSVPLSPAPAPAAPSTYPESRFLCDQRVYGKTDDGPMEIHWTLNASAHSVTRVADHYRKSGGGPGSLAGGEHVFEFPSGHRVTVFPVSARGRHPSCGTSPRTGEQTLIRISRALSPKTP